MLSACRSLQSKDTFKAFYIEREQKVLASASIGEKGKISCSFASPCVVRVKMFFVFSACRVDPS